MLSMSHSLHYSVYRTMVECDKWQTVRYGFLSHEAKPSVIRAHEHCLSLITRDHVRYTFYTTRTVQCNLWNVNFLQLFLKKFNEIFLQCDKFCQKYLSHWKNISLNFFKNIWRKSTFQRLHWTVLVV